MAVVPYTSRSIPGLSFERTMGSSDLNALGQYYPDNESIVRTDPIIGTLLGYIGRKLFGAGIQFMRGNSLLRAPPDFDPDSLVPFLFETLPFIVAHGVLVFYVHFDPETGKPSAHVPEYSLIGTRDTYDEETKQPIFTAEWRDPKRTDKLYVFNTGNPFGRKPTQTRAPIDMVKDLLHQYYYNLEMHTVAKDGNSRPPFVLESQPTGRDAAASAADLGIYDTELERRILQNMHTVGLDDMYVERIRRAADPARRTYSRPDDGGSGPMPWWMRVRARVSAPPESRFMYIPHGLSIKTGQQGMVDTNFSKDQMEILQAIYLAFGIPYTAILAPASQQSSTGIELHKTMLADTLRVWNRVYATILTDVYRLMYDVRGVEVVVEKGDGGDATPGVGGRMRVDRLYTTVSLRGQFITTPEQARALYDEGVISWETFQTMRLESLSLPTSIADRSVPPAARMMAQTQAQFEKMNAKATDGKPPAKK